MHHLTIQGFGHIQTKLYLGSNEQSGVLAIQDHPDPIRTVWSFNLVQQSMVSASTEQFEISALCRQFAIPVPSLGPVLMVRDIDPI